jgi:Flp pilus assembly CpaE family ATPase
MVTRIQPAVSDPDAARSLVGLLRQLPDSEPLPPAVDSTQLLDSLGQMAAGSVADLPEIVLVHELIGPRPALELIREVALRFPAVGVVLITRDTSPPLYSAAMDAGARGVLGLPLSYDDLAARVGAAASWASGVRRHLGGETEELTGPGGTVVAVTGAKGGVGTTLAAVQLALAAQASGRGSVLVDMDLQSGDVASYLDVQFRRSAADLAGISDISARVLQDAVYSHESGLGLLLAPGDGERGEEVDDRAARQIIGALRGRYDIVLVDCGTQLNAANAAAIETADLAVLLTTPDVVSVRAAKRMVRMWDRLQIRKAEDTVTLVNRTSRLSEIQPSLIARIVGTPVARSTVPANYKELQSAVDAGRMQDLDSKGSVRQALWGFAGELGLVTATEPPSGKQGKTGRGVKGLTRQQPRQVTGPPPRSQASGGRALPPGGQAKEPGGPGAGTYGSGDASGTQGGVHGPRQGGAPQGAQGEVGAASDGNRQALPPGPSSRTLGAAPNKSAGGGRYGAEANGPNSQNGPSSPSLPDPSSQDAPGAALPVRGQIQGTAPPAGPGTDRGSQRPEGAQRPQGAPGARQHHVFHDDDDGEPSVWGDRGALTIEFAGVAPIVLVTLAILWQCVLIGYTFSLAGNAADEGARAATAAASDGDAEGACRAAATEHLPAKWREESKVNCALSDHVWKADVDLAPPVLFPGADILPFTVSGRAGAAEEG